MSENTPQSLILTLISKGNELALLAKKACIFRASITYLAQHIHSFLYALKPLAPQIHTENQIRDLNRISDLFTAYANILSHLSESKWIQPALNWPSFYIYDFISGFRNGLIKLCPEFGLDSSEIFSYDDQQDKVNKIADLKSLKSSVENLLTQINVSDAVGVNQQISTRIKEISKLLSNEIPQKHNTSKTRQPSCDSIPVLNIQHRVEEMLTQFKSINIENDDLLIHSQIGIGGFGTVSKATRLSTAEIVAVKELRSDRLTTGSWASLYAEIETMASVRHQFVLELVGAHITEPYRIITQYCQGKSLFDRLHRCTRQETPLSPTRLTIIAYEVAVGIEHLHSLDIVHRDLKTLNILLDEEGDGCVADFGLSGMMKDNQELCGGVGTPHYTAPEVLSHTRYGPKVDSFSYGVVLWEILTRKIPYENMSHMAIYEFVVTRGWRLQIPNEAPGGLRRLITRCWSKNPNDRPSFTEIVQLFESGDVYFPKSDKSQFDFLKIKKMRRCPPLDLEYAISVLKDPRNEYFSRVSKFIYNHIDDKIRIKLRESKIIDSLKNADANIGTILLLASALLDEEEFPEFFENGGFSMFEECVTNTYSNQRPMMISAAAILGLKVPSSMLSQLKKYLPDLVNFMTNNKSHTNNYIAQFLTRFPLDDLAEFKEDIAKSLLQIIEKVDDQKTFNSIVAVLPLCKSIYKLEQFRSFYHLLSLNFNVPSVFIETLIQVDDKEKRAELIFAILKATATSNVTNVFLDFLQKCDPDELDQVWRLDDFFRTMDDLLSQNDVSAPLFLLFKIASIKEAAVTLSDSKVLQTLIQMKGYKVQRLSILTVLCSFEKFCTNVSDFAGILQLLVTSLGDKMTVNSAIQLMCSLSSHNVGCQILSDNGVLELFSQLFLSSSVGDVITIQTILRNVAQHGGEIPQVSLIVSCLMQDMIYQHSKKTAILETLIALVKTAPSSVQEHDLQRIVIQQFTQEKPLIVLLSLRLFAVCDMIILRNIYPQILVAIYNLLNRPQMMYPEIIQEILTILANMSKQYEIGDFLEKTELIRFFNEIIELLPKESKRAADFKKLVQSI